MALLHRALIAWFVALIFLILLVLQLDHRTQWSWYLVLVPIWFWDGLIVVLLILHLISLARQQHMRSRPLFFCRKVATLMSPVVLKITFQCLMCGRLDLSSNSTTQTYTPLPLYYLFIPLWLLLLAALVKLTRILIPTCNE